MSGAAPRGAFIFDFDGTIADTFSVIVPIADVRRAELGGRPLDPEELLAIAARLTPANATGGSTPS